MLDQNLKQQLQGLLDKVPGRVELQLTLDASAESRELEQLAHELAALSDRVALASTPGNAKRTPTLEIVAADRGTRISFAGIPSGHEFT
ncbi:MAG TPA: alkyl hydroperoxide reductase subunit F, partial [Pseudomonadales bacterium]